MKKLTHMSLFSGFGGLDLAAEWAGFQTIGQCEYADYPTKVLVKHWPNVPRWRDIRALTGENFYERTGLRTIDIISGGFPCQPFSVAGKRRGKEDDRYLWPEMVRVIKELRPTWVVGENVAGIIRMALPEILSELEGCGYSTRTFLVPACAVGARHRRYRVAIVSHANGGRQLYRKNEIDTAEIRESTQCELVGCGQDVQYTYGAGRQELHIASESDRQGFPCGGCDAGNVSDTDNRSGVMWWESCKGGAGEAGGGRNNNVSGAQKYDARERWATEPRMGMLVDGLPAGMGGCIDLDFLISHYWDIEPDIPKVATGVRDRVGKLKGFGNAVVPQQFYPLFKSIADVENTMQKNSIPPPDEI